MSYNPQNPNGQATSANSSPVVLASDQSAVGITANSSVNMNQVAGTTTDTNSGNKSAGTQRVVLATDQPQLTNALKVDGSAVTQPISAAALPLPATAATSTKQSDGSQKTQVVDGSGNVISATSNALDVNIKSNAAGGGTSSAFGAALPANGTAAGFTDGTNLQAARTYDSDSGAGTENTLGVVLRKTASGGSVEAGTSTNPLRTDPTGTTTQPVSGTVTANVGTTNGLALDASVTGLQVSQGSTTSGQKGDLALGAVTTAAPTYTTAQTNPLSLTTGGALRVDGSAATQPVSVSGTVTVDTELPAAAALADSTANPTTSTIASNGMLWDSNATTWNRQQSTRHGLNTTGTGVAAAGMMAEFDDTSPSAVTENQFAPVRMSSNRNQYTTLRDAAGNERGVNVTAGNALTVDGSASTQPVSGTVGITANSSVNVNQVAGTTVDTNSGSKSAGTQRIVLATDQPQLTNAFKVDGSAVTQPVSGTVTANAGTGNFGTNLAQVAGTTTDTNSGNKSAGTQRVVLATDQPAFTTPIPVNISPSTTGGWSVSSQTALTTTATVSGSAGKFGGYMFINLNSAPAYLQVFDTTGAVTLGTTTPTFVVPLPANGTAANGAGANLEMSNGVAITSGIKVAATTTATGATTVSTALTGFVLYK